MNQAHAQTTTTSPPPSPDASPLILGGLGLVVVFFFVMFLGGGSKKLTPQSLEKAKKKYVALTNKRLAGKVDEYNALIESRNMVTGLYEQKGNIAAVRFVSIKANCKRCQSLDKKVISLMDPVQLAACTPPVHNELRKGVTCEATFMPVRAAEMAALEKAGARPAAKALGKAPAKAGAGGTDKLGKKTGNLKSKKK